MLNLAAARKILKSDAGSELQNLQTIWKKKTNLNSFTKGSESHVSSRIKEKARKLIFLLWFTMIYWSTYKEIILNKLPLNP